MTGFPITECYAVKISHSLVSVQRVQHAVQLSVHLSGSTWPGC